MRILLQHTQDGRFYQRGDWTPDPQAAEDFANTLRALNVQHERKIKNAQILLKFENAAMDIVLNLDRQV